MVISKIQVSDPGPSWPSCCIKPSLPFCYKHALTGENQALTGENVHLSVDSRAVNDHIYMFNILDPGLHVPCKQCMLNLCPCQFPVLRPTRLYEPVPD